ncbi:PD-(D/E)XK nuclease family protein [Enhygromyxa salina]|nr:PD-(D/E)XK nuclease family protein [Enhygromyxa salina]
MQGDLVERLVALSEQHTPGRVLVLVRRAVAGRWLSSLLAERGAAVGVRILDLEGLLSAAMLELAGEMLSPVVALAAVREALLADPSDRYAAIAEQPSYQREALRAFVELERGLGGRSLDTVLERVEGGPDGRDAGMLQAFARFRELAREQAGWWRGEAPELVVAGRRRVSFLRRRAAAVAIGLVTPLTSQWEGRLLDGLGFERWGSEFGCGELSARRALDLRLACAGPEAEIAAVARSLRAAPEQPAVVLAPSDSVPRWVDRLRHRDVPVRAFVERRAANTGAARTVRALLRVLSSPSAVRRDDLETLLFGSALRTWSSSAAQLGIDYPRSPHPGDLHRAWELQRASSFSLGGLEARLRAAGESSVDALRERGRRLGWDDAQLDERRARARGAHRLLASAVERLDALAQDWSAPGLRELLDDWDLLGRAAVHGVAGAEMTAARVVIEACARADTQALLPSTPASFGASLDHALASASAGSWEQTRAEGGGGGPPVWVLPYASVPAVGQLPPRLFLTGLDAHPRPPVHHDLISDSLRSSLGLVADRARFVVQLRQLDELLSAAAGPVVGSWRHRDGAGARRPPGPWIAGRQAEGEAASVGVDVIALPAAGSEPSAPIEDRLVDWASEGELRRRVEAIRSHEAAGVGPHTGVLGVRVEPGVPYSASSLQRYAQLPYQYFVERVIGLRERQQVTDSQASLLATEQGQVVHRALETAHAARLAAGQGGLELASVSEPLLTEVLDALAQGYRKRAEHGQAEAIWASERERWAVELREWWQHWQQRLQAGWAGPGGEAARSTGRAGTRRGRPEPEQLVPGMFLLAAEWSPVPEGASSFELDLSLRTIPFVAVIDRVEFDPYRNRLDVVDFKTGRPRWASAIADQLRAGVHLQLPLYALAIQQVVAAAPERLHLPQPVPVGALRLEYLQRPLPRGGKLITPEARGFAPGQPLGLDASGQVWTILGAAASFCLAFVTAIEAGRFPVVARAPGQRSFAGSRSSRIEELARVVPSAELRRTGLPPALSPLPDPRSAREVVQ